VKLLKSTQLFNGLEDVKLNEYQQNHQEQ